MRCGRVIVTDGESVMGRAIAMRLNEGGAFIVSADGGDKAVTLYG